jgi:dolichyl-phosphate beta-glucosyltransferase
MPDGWYLTGEVFASDRHLSRSGCRGVPGIVNFMNSMRQRDVRRSIADFSLILPMFNPGPRLATSLHKLHEFVATADAAWELVFVSDGCTDDSVSKLKTFVNAHVNSRIIEYSPNRGKGYAVRQGMLAASAPFRLFTDIDLAYSFADIRRVAAALYSGASVAIASRTHAESQLVVRPHNVAYIYRRQLQSAAFSHLARMILPIQHRDTQAGLKGMSEAVVREIVPQLICDGFGFDCEILTACARLTIPVTEIPVCVNCDETTSTTRFRTSLRMVGDLFRIRKHWSNVATSRNINSSTPRLYREAG